MNAIKRLPKMLYGGDYNPDQWLAYPEILEKDIELMKKAGANAMSVGIFAWAALEPEEGKYCFEWLDDIINKMYANGIYTVLATPSGARPAWMAQKYPEVLRVNSDGKRILFSERHNHCLTSRVYREKVREINKKLAERYSSNPAVILWHISNEYNGECYCENCIKSFREWLKKKYGTLEKLNHAYWSYFWSHTYTDWEQINPPMRGGERNIHGLSLDWLRYNTDMTVDFMTEEVKPLRAVCPDIPVTTNMMGFYQGLNYFKFKDICDIISWDNYPCWHENDDIALASNVAMTHDLMRSIKPGEPFLMMESTPSMTNWQRRGKLKRPGMNILSSLQAVAHGSDSVQYFQWRDGRGGSEKFHGSVVGHSGRDDTRVFREAAELGGILSGLDELCGSKYISKAAIICDTENRWAVDMMRGLNNEDKGFMQELALHYKPLCEGGVNVDLIDMESDLSGYELVIAPMLYLLRAGIADKLRDFTEKGGTLVATYELGISNETDLCYLGGTPGAGLSELFGIESEEIDTLYQTDSNTIELTPYSGLASSYKVGDYCELLNLKGAKALAVYGSDFYKGRPAVTLNSYGKGKAYYIATRADESFYFDFYNKLIQKLSLKPLDVTLPHGVFMTARTTDSGEKLVIFQNFNTEEVSLTLPREMKDIETGEASSVLVLAAYGSRIIK